MNRNVTGNQRGEVITGVMVAIMVVMMLFGGMHMMHGSHQHDDGPERSEHKHDHQKKEMHHEQSGDRENSAVQDEEKGE